MAVATANGMATNQLPIHSQAQLDTYLRTHASEPTPLDALTPGARERFIDGLVFGRNGLSGFETTDLPQLTREQGRALLALFGAEQYADTLTNWAKHARAADTTATISTLERRYNGYNRILRQRQAEREDPWPSLRAALPEAFDRSAAAQLDNASLTLLYRAIVATYLVRPTPAGLQAQLDTLELLRDRGQADAAQLDAAGNALLLAHRTEDARRLLANGGSADWPHWLHFDDRLGPGAHGPTLWSLDTDGTTLRRQRIDLRTPRILITAGCHLSDDAARAIANDPELGPAFRRHALWLSNPPGAEDMSALRKGRAAGHQIADQVGGAQARRDLHRAGQFHHLRLDTARLKPVGQHRRITGGDPLALHLLRATPFPLLRHRQHQSALAEVQPAQRTVGFG